MSAATPRQSVEPLRQCVSANFSDPANENRGDSEKTVRGLLERASLHHKQGQYDAALLDCDAILKLDDRCDFAYAQAIDTLLALSRGSDAVGYATRWSKMKLQALAHQESAADVGNTINERAATENTDKSLCRNDGSGFESNRREIPSNSFNVKDSDTTYQCTALLEAITDPVRANPDASGSGEKVLSLQSGWRCSFCSEHLMSPSELRMHLRGAEHMARVTSDSERTWHYRQPPNGLIDDEYSLCEKHCIGGPSSCRYGESCIQAHSQAELDEWQKRFAFRQRKTLDAEKEAATLLRSAGPPSLAEYIREHLLSSRDGTDRGQSSLLVQTLDGVKMACSSDLNISTSCKKFEHNWEFEITSAMTLQEMAFVEEAEDASSSPFYFLQVRTNLSEQSYLSKMPANRKCREWTNEKLLPSSEIDKHGRHIYSVKIGFKTSVFGTFEKLVAFAFGKSGSLKPPFVTRFLRVEVKPVDLELVTGHLKMSESRRWDAKGSGIALVPFAPRPPQLSEYEEQLIAKYTCPSPETFQFCAELASRGLTRHNYKKCLHELLFAEEMAQYYAISKFNVEAVLHISNVIGSADEGVGGYKYSTGGELFARVELKSVINEDSREGRLLLQNVTAVYLQPQANTSSTLEHQKAYEAVIEEKGATWITFRLSQATVQECRLHHDQTGSFLMQFIPSRLTLCELHWAVDEVRCLDALFPDIGRLPPVPWRPSLCQLNGLMCKDRALNAKQVEAVACITLSRSVSFPPILLLGPFGTGKTFTFAQAALKLVTEEPDARVLLCTHSNSAADLYVREYFDRSICPLAEAAGKKPNELLVRIYYRNRRVNTVEPRVLNYCLLRPSANDFWAFRDPALEDLRSARIVVTTLMASRCLGSIGLPEDFFTHILIDEAAQATEPETLVPLGVASGRTRIALAGDHMQMNPEVYSDLARSHCLQVSLLERLHDLYPDTASTKIMLCENYRSHPAIVKFASATFYDGSLVASGNQLNHPWLHPLCFFTARGDDTPLHAGAVGYYNNAEVFETVDRVAEIWKSWPTERWGELSDTSIGVVTPYADQVIRIRSELRKRLLHRVSVERVFNVQGKQFRVLIISTVRTSRTCTASDADDAGVNYGFLTDAKLLNTAMTRAQSLVAVVGDPLSLCSVGRCRKIWESYIETCHVNGSLYGITWNEVRAHLDGLNIKKTFTLNPLAVPFVPRYLFYTFLCNYCGNPNEVMANAAVAEIPGHAPVAPCLVHIRPRPAPSLLRLPLSGLFTPWRLPIGGATIQPLSTRSPSAFTPAPTSAAAAHSGQAHAAAAAGSPNFTAANFPPLSSASSSSPVAIDKDCSSSNNHLPLADPGRMQCQPTAGAAPKASERSSALSQSATGFSDIKSADNLLYPVSGPVRPPPLNTCWGVDPSHASSFYSPQVCSQPRPSTYPENVPSEQLQQHLLQAQLEVQRQVLPLHQLQPLQRLPTLQQQPQQLHAQQLQQQQMPPQLLLAQQSQPHVRQQLHIRRQLPNGPWQLPQLGQLVTEQHLQPQPLRLQTQPPPEPKNGNGVISGAFKPPK